MSKLENLFKELEENNSENVNKMNNNLINQILEAEAGETDEEILDAFRSFYVQFMHLLDDLENMKSSKDVKMIARVLHGYLAETDLMKNYKQGDLLRLIELVKYGEK